MQSIADLGSTRSNLEPGFESIEEIYLDLLTCFILKEPISGEHTSNKRKMDIKQFEFWQKWLTYANLMTILVGLMVAFAGNSFAFEMHNTYTREVFFSAEEMSPDVLRFKNWLFGIIGGTIVGFHILMVMISEYPFKQKEAWAYKAMWMGLLSWFCIDSGISFYYGAIHNIVIINLVALIIIGLPLIMTRNEFRRNKIE